jgi:hypothetical protein
MPAAWQAADPSATPKEISFGYRRWRDVEERHVSHTSCWKKVGSLEQQIVPRPPPPDYFAINDIRPGSKVARVSSKSLRVDERFMMPTSCSGRCLMICDFIN